MILLNNSLQGPWVTSSVLSSPVLNNFHIQQMQGKSLQWSEATTKHHSVIKLITNRWAWELVPKRLVGSRSHEPKGRYPWQPWKREPPPQAAANRHRHTEWLVETTYLTHTYLEASTQARGRGRGENPQRFAHRGQLIHNDQQAALHKKSDKTQKPCRSHTVKGETADCISSSLTLPKLY